MKSRTSSIIKGVKIMISIILAISLPALITVCVELMQLREIQETKEWILGHPYQFVLGYLFVLIFFIIIYIASARLWLAMLASSIIFMTFAMINYYKIILRGDPFMPWDLMLQKELANIVTHLNISVDQTSWGIIGVLLGLTLILLFIKPMKISWHYRLAGLIISMLIGTVAMQETYLNSDKMAQLGIEDIFWNQKRNYEINGFLTGFGMNIKNAIIKAPEAYSEKNVNKTIDHAIEAIPVFSQDEIKTQPNIIMIMNEAFWDPTLLTNIEYSKDPIPTLNKIRQQGESGWLLAPGYGGGTANTEFEVLTGHSMTFFPTGSMAYQQYIKGPLDSMASYLKGKGYGTIAIHPYEKWFWDRENVYPYLGFDEFISNEDFVAPDKRGPFISDMEASKEIIRQYEKNAGKPFFNYTVTMQNHGPYNDKRYGEDTIRVRADYLSEESKDLLETYSQGVTDADQALAYLIDYFESIDQATIIVMFGDHLPMLGNEYLVYKEAGYVSQQANTLEDIKNLHLTPLVIWNNYRNEKNDIGIINASYLGAYIMQYANMDMPAYFNFLNQLHQELPAYIKGLALDQDGIMTESLNKDQENMRQKHWMFQYDLMFGKKYSRDILYAY